MFIADCLKKNFEGKRALFAEHLILVKSMQLHIYVPNIYRKRKFNDIYLLIQSNSIQVNLF